MPTPLTLQFPVCGLPGVPACSSTAAFVPDVVAAVSHEVPSWNCSAPAEYVISPASGDAIALPERLK